MSRSKETPNWSAKKAKHIETGVKAKNSETCVQHDSKAIKVQQPGHRSTLEAIWGGGKSICQKLKIWNNPLHRNYTMNWTESQVGWVVRGAILVRAWDGFVRVRILQGAFSTFFKFYQTFRACNFFQHILANSGFSLWYLAHFKELPELRLTTCSHLLIFHFYYIKMVKNGQFFEVFLSFSMARTTFNQL